MLAPAVKEVNSMLYKIEVGVKAWWILNFREGKGVKRVTAGRNTMVTRSWDFPLFINLTGYFINIIKCIYTYWNSELLFYLKKYF